MNLRDIVCNKASVIYKDKYHMMTVVCENIPVDDFTEVENRVVAVVLVWTLTCPGSGASYLPLPGLSGLPVMSPRAPSSRNVL